MRLKASQTNVCKRYTKQVREKKNKLNLCKNKIIQMKNP